MYNRICKRNILGLLCKACEELQQVTKQTAMHINPISNIKSADILYRCNMSEWTIQGKVLRVACHHEHVTASSGIFPRLIRHTLDLIMHACKNEIQREAAWILKFLNQLSGNRTPRYNTADNQTWDIHRHQRDSIIYFLVLYCRTFKPFPTHNYGYLQGWR